MLCTAYPYRWTSNPYMGTTEHTKNLFMSALALPAVLSGGINMSNLSTAAESKILELNTQTKELQRALQGIHGIETESIDRGAVNDISHSFIPALIGITTAYAEQAPLLKTNESNSGIQITTESLDKKYHILFSSSSDKTEIMKAYNKLNTKLSIPNVKVVENRGKYYLLQREPKTKSDALIYAIDLKMKHGLSTKLLKIK